MAAHREMSGHTDPAVALGPAPRSGQTEAYASWRSAWRALGRPEADRAEAEMSDGQLRMRARAHQREQPWAPAYVGEELAGTHQAAARHREDAAMRRAEARNTPRPHRASAARRPGRRSRRTRPIPPPRADQLAAADDARATWLAHTVETRAAADRATAELSAREAAGTLVDEPHVTANEWLSAHDEHTKAEDPHRAITDEIDLAEHTAHQTAVPDIAASAKFDTPHLEVAESDIREVAAAQPAPIEHDTVHVPTAQEAADTIDRAQRALAEIHQREAAERDHTANEARITREARWHTDDTIEADRTADRAPVMARSDIND